MQRTTRTSDQSERITMNSTRLQSTNARASAESVRDTANDGAHTRPDSAPLRFSGLAAASALSVALMLPGVANAQHGYQLAEVVGVEPVYETVRHSVPREVCTQREVAYSEPRYRRASATGPILGAIIGGAIGNAVGHRKRNKQVGTAVGALLGGSIGADVSRRARYEDGRVSYRTQEVCDVVRDVREEQRVSGYRVSYEYGGEVYTTRMATHPGETIRVRVHVTPVG